MKITMIPDENHVPAQDPLMKITIIPDENHVSSWGFSEENHDIWI